MIVERQIAARLILSSSKLEPSCGHSVLDEEQCLSFVSSMKPRSATEWPRISLEEVSEHFVFYFPFGRFGLYVRSLQPANHLVVELFSDDS